MESGALNRNTRKKTWNLRNITASSNIASAGVQCKHIPGGELGKGARQQLFLNRMGGQGDPRKTFLKRTYIPFHSFLS